MLQPDWETKRRRTAITFYLRNDGGVAAQDVVHTIRFRNGDGEVVHEHEYIPEGGTIEPGYAEQQAIVVERVPEFSTLSIATRKREQAVFDPGVFTDAPDVQVAQIAVSGDEITAMVRNITGGDVVDLEIAFTLPPPMAVTFAMLLQPCQPLLQAPMLPLLWILPESTALGVTRLESPTAKRVVHQPLTTLLHRVR